MCLNPSIIRNKRYEPNKKNGGIVPPVNDIRTTTVAVGCGECIECRTQKAKSWAVRLQEEIKTNKNGKFVTLTFSTKEITKLYKEIETQDEVEQWKRLIDRDEIPEKRTGYDKDNAAATLAIRRFLERWRKKYKKSVRHWLITEIGGKNWEHIHIHGIIFTDKKIEEIWKYGGVYIGRWREGLERGQHYVNAKTINYIVKYITKIDLKHRSFKSKIHTSAGIGSEYINSYNAKINKYKEGKTKETYTTENRRETALPIYYRNKIYSDEEREKLWIEKLDKGDRYVCGEKITINWNDEESIKKYKELLDYHKERTRKMGYNPNKTWKIKDYERQQREIMITKRKESDNNKSIGYKEAWKEQKVNRKKYIDEWNKRNA